MRMFHFVQAIGYATAASAAAMFHQPEMALFAALVCVVWCSEGIIAAIKSIKVQP